MGILVVLAVIGCLSLTRSGPAWGMEVDSVRAARRPGTLWVDVSYGLPAGAADTVSVFLEASDDGGRSYDIPVLSVTGDVGEAVPAGGRRSLLWDAGADAPDLAARPWRVRLVVVDGEDAPLAADRATVPAGPFTMGADDGDPHERPVHRVHLSAFLIDRLEVTNRRFARFVQATGYLTDAEREGRSVVYLAAGYRTVDGASWRSPAGGSGNLVGRLDHPVVQVTWADAAAFCRWSGDRLPTEAEWEKAARGPGALLYPWGAGPPDAGGRRMANYGTNSCCDASDADGFAATAPAGSFPDGTSPYGALDMAGNVWEWTSDWYSRRFYEEAAARDPLGPPAGDERSLRGGSWVSNPFRLRTSFRGHHTEQTRHNYGGFRCVRDGR